MAEEGLEAQLGRWVGAGIVDGETAAAIRAYEAGRAAETPAPKLRWPIAIVLGLGGLLLGAGLLLFVAAHWDGLSPAGRLGVVLAMLVGLHVGAALPDSSALRTTLHAVGTVAMGAGVYLVGQIFHLNVHWPTGLLLWALGALAGVLLLGDWPQAVLLAVLAPAWLAAEQVTSSRYPWDSRIAATGLFLLALAYVGADAGGRRGAIRRAIGIVGAIALLPLAVSAQMTERTVPWSAATAVAWTVAYGVPPAVAAAFGGGPALAVVAAMGLWTIVGPHGLVGGEAWARTMVYAWFAAAALGVVLWGFFARIARAINVGIAGFAITVGVFYFSNVMDKLGRSASLVGLGLLFLGGGYALERVRRRLVAGATTAAS